MELNNFYLHAIDCNDGKDFDEKNALVKLEKILQSGYILSRRKMGDLDERKGGWNGFDYISLCDYAKKDAPPYENNSFYKGYTAYDSYIMTSLSLIINKKWVRAITPTLVHPVICDWNSLQEMRYIGIHYKARYTDFPDEVQVKNQITLNRLEGITIPISYMVNEKGKRVFSTEEIKYFLNRTKELLKKYEREVPVYDLGTMTQLDSDKTLTMVIEQNKRI